MTVATLMSMLPLVHSLWTGNIVGNIPATAIALHVRLV